MTAYNNMVGPVNAHCVDMEVVTVKFLPNGGSSPTSVSAPFTTTVTRTAAGTYTVSMVGWSPKSVLGAHAIGTDAANAKATRVAVDGAFTVTNSTKTVSFFVTTTDLAGTPKDIAANAASTVQIVLFGKVYPGTDKTGQ